MANRLAPVLIACLSLLGVFAAPRPAGADPVAAAPGDHVVVKLDSGGDVAGIVLRDGPSQLVIRAKYGTIGLGKADIVSVEKAAKEEEAAGVGPGPTRLPAWDTCIERLAARPCGKDLRQIPATLIDKGILKFVPYMSHRAGDFEFNIYGDPDDPAGIEIGIVKDAPKTDAAKAECRDLILGLLSDPADRAAVTALKFDTGKTPQGGLTFEITPPTAEDAYGGWWISIYNEPRLDQARAKPEELAEITTKEVEAPKAAPSADPWAWKSQDYREARPPAAAPRVPPPATQPPSAPQPPVLASRIVYVRGYCRRGGAYIRHRPARPPKHR